MRRRINRGETLLDVVNNPVRRPGGKAKIHIEYKGQIYTVRELSEKYNIPSEIIRVRWHNGWTAGKIVETPVMKGKLYTYEGQQYTAHELYNLLGSRVSWETCKNRLRYGWSIERAIRCPYKRTRRARVSGNGEI